MSQNCHFLQLLSLFYFFNSFLHLPHFFYFFLSFQLFLYYTLLFLGPKDITLRYWCTWKSCILNVSFDDITKIFLSKKSFSERVDKLLLDLNAVHGPLSICSDRFGDFGQAKKSDQAGKSDKAGKSGQVGEFSWSKYSLSELSIRLSNVLLYLLGIVASSDFPSDPLNHLIAYLFPKNCDNPILM